MQATLGRQFSQTLFLPERARAPHQGARKGDGTAFTAHYVYFLLKGIWSKRGNYVPQFYMVVSDLCFPPPLSLCPSNKAILRIYYISDENDVISFPLSVGTLRNEGAARVTSYLQQKLHLP